MASTPVAARGGSGGSPRKAKKATRVALGGLVEAPGGLLAQPGRDREEGEGEVVALPGLHPPRGQGRRQAAGAVRAAPRPVGDRPAGGGCGSCSPARRLLEVERVDEVAGLVGGPHPVVDVDVEVAAGEVGGADRHAAGRRCGPRRCAGRLAPSVLICATSWAVTAANTRSWMPQPKSGRITRSPLAVARMMLDRLLDVLLVGHRLRSAPVRRRSGAGRPIRCPGTRVRARRSTSWLADQHRRRAERRSALGAPASTTWSPCRAAGRPPMSTVALPTATTPPTCGLGPSDERAGMDVARLPATPACRRSARSGSPGPGRAACRGWSGRPPGRLAVPSCPPSVDLDRSRR